MYFETENSAYHLHLANKDYIELIADNMIRTRPMKNMVYRPCIQQKGISSLPDLSFDKIDLSKYYPEAKEGDYVYLRVGLTSDRTQEIVATVAGNVEIFYDGKQILKTRQVESADIKDYEYVPLMLKEGINELVLKCTCHNHSFQFYFLTALKLFVVMKARDYLFHTRVVIARGEYRGEDGYEISRLYQAGEETAWNQTDYVFPEPSRFCRKIDFAQLEKEDTFAAAVTYALENTRLTLQNESGMILYINRQEVCRGSQICIDVQKEDEIAVICEKGKDFGFTWDSENVGIPFLETQRKYGACWLLLSVPKIREDLIKTLNFNMPYESEGQKRFWRLQDGSYLRVYMETCFFGQWFYAAMVGNYGLLLAEKATDRSDYQNYFIKNMKYMLDYYEYAVYDAQIFGEASVLQRGTALKDLDSIGTMGMNFSEYYNLTQDDGAIALIKKLEHAMFTQIPRFSDGTFRRPSTMWADDTFMSCPFMVRLAQLFGKEEYYDELKRQLTGFRKRLFMEDKKLYSHIFFPDTGLMNRIPWGRGNGWIMLTLTEILLHLSAGHRHYEFFCNMLCEFAEGILACQDENGMWHQVLDRPDSYAETSSTAMFVLSLARGVRLNVLEREQCSAAIRKGMNALLRYAIDKNGNVYGVCKGSGCAMEVQYYMELETAFNDDHGTGIILAALSEVGDDF